MVIGPGGVFSGFVKASRPAATGYFSGQYLGIDAATTDLRSKGGIRIGDGFHDDILVGFV